jgi:hypothetical protein
MSVLIHAKTLAERLEYLAADARRILAAPNRHQADEIQWAKDMLASEKHALRRASSNAD